MDKVILGRTNLEVSVAGLGCGGFSRLGLGTGKDHSNAVSVVKTALQNDIDFIDTAEAYKTESAVGEGIKGFDRSKLVISTKFAYSRDFDGELRSAKEFVESLDASLKALQTDYIDIYHLHAVRAKNYKQALEMYYPEMEKARDKGKIRFLGITELFHEDTTHEMLNMSAKDLFDVVMIGYNILNPSAAKELMPAYVKHNIGTLCMFAVRNAFSRPERLEELLEPYGIKDLNWLVDEGYASSMTEAAYRFCRYVQGMHVILTGTGNTQHLLENVKSINKPALDGVAVERLMGIFADADGVSGQ